MNYRCNNDNSRLTVEHNQQAIAAITLLPERVKEDEERNSEHLTLTLNVAIR